MAARTAKKAKATGERASKRARAVARKAATRAAAPTLSFRAVDRRTWPDFEKLFETRGPKYCWCMAWRANAQEVRQTDSRSRKAAMERRVQGGVPVGILGYLDGEPIAWCSIAPRDTYRASLGGTALEDAEGVWSLACLFIERSHRGQGITRLLIEAAMAHARKRGARVIEAYPVDPESPSYRFMGFRETFEAMGFEHVGRAGSRRHVMRHAL